MCMVPFDRQEYSSVPDKLQIHHNPDQVKAITKEEHWKKLNSFTFSGLKDLLELKSYINKHLISSTGYTPLFARVLLEKSNFSR